MQVAGCRFSNNKNQVINQNVLASPSTACGASRLLRPAPLLLRRLPHRAAARHRLPAVPVRRPSLLLLLLPRRSGRALAQRLRLLLLLLLLLLLSHDPATAAALRPRRLFFLVRVPSLPLRPGRPVFDRPRRCRTAEARRAPARVTTPCRFTETARLHGGLVGFATFRNPGRSRRARRPKFCARRAALLSLLAAAAAG